MHAHLRVGAAASGSITPTSDETPAVAAAEAPGGQDKTADPGSRSALDEEQVRRMPTIKLRSDQHRLEAEWRPRPPTRHQLPRVLDPYREARAEFLPEVLQRIDRDVACLEMPL